MIGIEGTEYMASNGSVCKEMCQPTQDKRVYVYWFGQRG